MADRPVTYWDYIKVEQLLGLQTGTQDTEEGLANDEVMFVVIHQIDELWFKLGIRELVAVRDLFAQQHVREQSLSSGVRGIRRAALLFSQAAAHFPLMETLTTRDYLAFRDKLYPASGFQSAQMREIELLMGLEESDRISLGHENYLQALRNHDGSESPASKRVLARMDDKPTLREALDEWLYRAPIDGSTPDDADDQKRVEAFVDAYVEAHARQVKTNQAVAVKFALTDEDRSRVGKRYDAEIANARAWLKASEVQDPTERARRGRIRAALVFIESYRELPLLAWPREVLDSIVALEQSFTIFRQRHARMVERVIGRRTGTGGSAGVDYLDNTALKYRVFRDVWATRTMLLRSEALPKLHHPEHYGFAGADD
jgi:tryptophan 2,3-dioxygenase